MYVIVTCDIVTLWLSWQSDMMTPACHQHHEILLLFLLKEKVCCLQSIPGHKWEKKQLHWGWARRQRPLIQCGEHALCTCGAHLYTVGVMRDVLGCWVTYECAIYPGAVALGASDSIFALSLANARAVIEWPPPLGPADTLPLTGWHLGLILYLGKMRMCCRGGVGSIDLESHGGPAAPLSSPRIKHFRGALAEAGITSLYVTKVD